MDDYSKKVYQFGIQRGEKRGEKRGYKLGEEQGAAKFVQALLKQNKTVEEIAQQFDMTEDNVRKCAKLKLD